MDSGLKFASYQNMFWTQNKINVRFFVNSIADLVYLPTTKNLLLNWNKKLAGILFSSLNNALHFD